MGLVAVSIGFLLSLVLLMRQGRNPARLTLAQGIMLAAAPMPWCLGRDGLWALALHYFVVGEVIAYGIGSCC